jgi:hypothetical protein
MGVLLSPKTYEWSIDLREEEGKKKGWKARIGIESECIRRGASK